MAKKEKLFLYAGDIPADRPAKKEYIGLSLVQNNHHHLRHDITSPMPLPDNCVDSYQSEDVFEHIEYDKLVLVIDEIYRVLKPGGLLRMSVPDYRCDILVNRSVRTVSGKIVFDPEGGGEFKQGRVINGGHVWFPTIETVRTLLSQSKFSVYGRVEYLHYYEVDGTFEHKPIDHSKGYVKRTPDNDDRVRNPYRGMSIVVDLYKGTN